MIYEFNRSSYLLTYLLTYILPPLVPILLIYLFIYLIIHLFIVFIPHPLLSLSLHHPPFLLPLLPIPSFQVKAGDCIMTVFGEEQVTAVKAVMGEGVYTVVTNEVRMYVRYKTAQAKHENSFFCMMLTVAIYWSPLLRCTIGVCTYVFLTIQNQIEVQYMFLFMSYIITLCITLFYHITSHHITSHRIASLDMIDSVWWRRTENENAYFFSYEYEVRRKWFRFYFTACFILFYFVSLNF